MRPVHPIQGMQGMRIPAPVIQIPEEILPIMILRERMAPIPGMRTPAAPIQGKGLIPGMEMPVPKTRAVLKGTAAGRMAQRMGTALDRKAVLRMKAIRIAEMPDRMDLRMRAVPLVKTVLRMKVIPPTKAVPRKKAAQLMRAILLEKVILNRKAARKSLHQTRLRNQKKIRIRKQKPARRPKLQPRRNPQRLSIPRLLPRQTRQDRTHRAGQENRVSFLRQSCKSL